LQDFFEYQGYEGVKGPKVVLEQAYEGGLISDGEKWVEMLDDRRLSKHTYDEVIKPEETRSKMIRAYKMLENKVDQIPRKKHGNIPL
jgi:nucleotidyltransferase substrate binding protein (TIGR01987 family)